MPRGFAPDYVQVNERIMAFREKFPDGSLQSEIVDLTEDKVVIKAFAYRTPEDMRPGIGHSIMQIPGKTPFTRDSEIENCETSAWGRALAALGFEVQRGIASAEEIENKSDGNVTITGSDVEGVGPGGRTQKANRLQIQQVKVLSGEMGLGVDGMAELIKNLFDADVLSEITETFDSEEDLDKAKNKAVSKYLADLSSEDIATVLEVMTAAYEAAQQADPDVAAPGYEG